MVCNTDPHDKPGEHWIAIYVEDIHHRDYFDSFGLEPDEPFKTFMNEHCSYWTFNAKHLQSAISRFCGQYCVFCCMLRARSRNINAICNSLTSDTGVNDYLFHKYVCRYSK